jgi:dUTP pyrophosphatase
MQNDVLIKFKRLSNEFDYIPLPSYSTEGSSGMDIRAALKQPLIIKPKELELIPSNLTVEIPAGYEIQIRPRSGLAAKHGIGILNSPGTIDSDYRGEIKIIIINLGKDNFIIQPGDRVAQLVVSKIYRANLKEVEELNTSNRGDGGFGHTGKS